MKKTICIDFDEKLAMKKTICIDFDGVIHSYTSPWQAAHIISDPPVPGAFDFLDACLDAGYEVAVFSTRSHQLGGRNGMISWFEQHHYKNVKFLGFPQDKPPAVLYIDDRGYQFTGKFPTLEYIQNFQPWNKRDPKPKRYRLLCPGEIVERGDEIFSDPDEGWKLAFPGGEVTEFDPPIRREDFTSQLAWPKPHFVPNPQISGNGVKINIDDKEKIL